MNSSDSATINSLFQQAVNDPQELSKLSQAAGAFIRQKLREVSFARKILPPVSVTKADCQRSVNHDVLVKIVDIEPDSIAMPLDFRAQPDGKWIHGERYEIPFSTIGSEEYSKSEQELLAYEMPITKIIEENGVKDIQKVEDERFLQYVEAAIAAATALHPSEPKSVTVSDTKVTRNVISQLAKLFPGQELRLACMLMHETDYADILNWEATDVGDKVASELTVDGYKYEKIAGYKLVTSIKKGVVTQGDIYGFADAEFLGNFFILNQTKFWIEKKANIISFRAWEDVGMGIGNIEGAGKVVLS